VISNVSFGLEKTRLTKLERRQRALEVLRSVGLENLANRYPHQLSGGQRQRVALARALAVNPSILLMDEPFSALDALTREALQDELIRVWTGFQKTVLFITHDIDEAVYLADRVVALGGKPGEVKASVRIDVPRPRARNDHALRVYADKVKAELIAEAIARDDWVI
jgi:NitT/TauT family transport system ATP-binding protein